MNLKSRLASVLVFGCILAFAFTAWLPQSSFAGTSILDISTNSDTIGLYEKLEVTFQLSATYENPFDPGEVDVRGIFMRPTGETLTVPGFYYQDYTRWLDSDDYEQFDPQGDSSWKIRFAPQEIGSYSYHIEVTDSRGASASETLSFDAVPSDDNGFVRIGSPTSKLFRFNSGEPFVPIGQRLGSTWTPTQDKGTYDYENYMQKMQDHQENTLRTLMYPENATLEWTPHYDDFGIWPYYSGLVGRYNMASAWKLDYLVDLAHLRGLRIVLCFETTRAFQEIPSREGLDWRSNPYSAANGGPLTSPEQFFSNNEAKDYYKRKLRYIVARWGYSPDVLAWQLFHEIDWLILAEHYGTTDVENVISWHREMATYIDQVDPFDHLITTSTASPVRWWADSAAWFWRLWALPELDVVDHHLYRFPDFEDDTVKNIRETLSGLRAHLNKPCHIWQWALDVEKELDGADTDWIGMYNAVWTSAMSLSSAQSWYRWPKDSYGLYYHFDALAHYLDGADTHGIGMHNALWTSAMSFSSALPWYWEHIDSDDLYHHFDALADYLAGEDLEAEALGEATLEVDKPEVEALGLSNRSKALLWVHNKQSVHNNPDPPVVAGATINVGGVQNGHYQIEIWDTYDGSILESRSSICTSGMLTIGLPDFKRDIAVKAVKVVTYPYTVFLPYVAKQHR